MKQSVLGEDNIRYTMDKYEQTTLIFSEVVPVRLLLNMQEKLEITLLQKETEGIRGEF